MTYTSIPTIVPDDQVVALAIETGLGTGGTLGDVSARLTTEFTEKVELETDRLNFSVPGGWGGTFQLASYRWRHFRCPKGF